MQIEGQSDSSLTQNGSGDRSFTIPSGKTATFVVLTLIGARSLTPWEFEYVIFRRTEMAVSRSLFAAILEWIGRLRLACAFCHGRGPDPGIGAAWGQGPPAAGGIR
jgi:hypothetical protein